MILKAAYSSLPTLIFEYRALKYIPFFAPIRLFPVFQGKVVRIYKGYFTNANLTNVYIGWLQRRMVHQFDSLSRIQVKFDDRGSPEYAIDMLNSISSSMWTVQS